MSTITRNRVGRYVLPNPQYDADDGARLSGVDVSGLSDRELFAEGVRVNAALAEAIAADCRIWLEWHRRPYQISAIDWLERRLRLIQAEVRKRKGSSR